MAIVPSAAAGGGTVSTAAAARRRRTSLAGIGSLGNIFEGGAVGFGAGGAGGGAGADDDTAEVASDALGELTGPRVKIWTGSWNVGAKEPFEGPNQGKEKDMLEWAPPGYDLYVVGVQEGVSDAVYDAFAAVTHTKRVSIPIGSEKQDRYERMPVYTLVLLDGSCTHLDGVIIATGC